MTTPDDLTYAERLELRRAQLARTFTTPAAPDLSDLNSAQRGAADAARIMNPFVRRMRAGELPAADYTGRIGGGE